MSSTQVKIALDKEKHPERYCPHPRCLWKTAKLNHETQQHEGGGFCPRHSNGAGDRLIDLLEPMKHAARTEGFFFAAMRKHGVL